MGARGSAQKGAPTEPSVQRRRRRTDDGGRQTDHGQTQEGTGTGSGSLTTPGSTAPTPPARSGTTRSGHCWLTTGSTPGSDFRNHRSYGSNDRRFEVPEKHGGMGCWWTPHDGVHPVSLEDPGMAGYRDNDLKNIRGDSPNDASTLHPRIVTGSGDRDGRGPEPSPDRGKTVGVAGRGRPHRPRDEGDAPEPREDRTSLQGTFSRPSRARPTGPPGG